VTMEVWSFEGKLEVDKILKEIFGKLLEPLE